MKSYTSIVLVLLPLILPGVLKAQQDSSFNPIAELSGSVSYAHNSTSHDAYSSSAYETTRHTWAIQPSVGVFVFEFLEVGLDVRYQRSRENSEFTSDHPSHLGMLSGSTTNTIAVALGPTYNLPLNQGIWVYAQLHLGLQWSAVTWDLWGDQSPKWSSTQVAFPIVQGGFKFFLNARSAFVVHCQFEQVTKTPKGIVAFGLGFSTLF
jgi:hypothetical protein